MPAPVEGRVFSRLQQFAVLPEELQNEVKALEVYLTENHAKVFGPHHANIIKTVRSVRAKPLTEAIVAWLTPKEEEPTPAAVDAAPAVVATEAAAAPVADTPAPVPEAPVTEAEVVGAAAAPVEATLPAEGEVAEAAPTPTETPAPETEAAAAAPPAATESEASKRLTHAKKLLEGLVLHGFITPNKEQEKFPSATNAPGSLVFSDRELFIPLAPDVTEITATTVWQLVDGAVFASVLKRKAGFLAPLTQGKDTYVVVNERLNALFLFDSDVSREPIVQLDASNAFVSFDKAHFVHGIKVWNDTTTELLNATDKTEQELLVHTLIKNGFTYKEEPESTTIGSIYELKDTLIDGTDVSFDAYKGKVLLLVNVSSACGLTPTNYPELAQLDAKYREQGLEILAFPCNQFGAQEPGSHDEIKEFVKQYDVSFPLFAKGDVNGTTTRPVFSYVKAKLPGTDGSAYIPWNFTKFLVDKNGQPVKRFAPTETPLSFESEIVTLLFSPPAVETTAEDLAAAAAVAGETTTTTEPAVVEAPVETTVEETPVETPVPAPVVAAAPAPAAVVPEPAAAVEEKTTTTKSDNNGKTETFVTSVVRKVTTLSVDDQPPPQQQQEEELPAKTPDAVAAEPETKIQALQAESSSAEPAVTPANEPAP